MRLFILIAILQLLVARQAMTDREIRESLLHNSRAQISNLKSIKNILIFFLVLTIIGLVFAFIGTMGALSTLGG